MAAERLDDFDRKILYHLQNQSDMGPAELSGVVHLSASQCSRRIQRLRQAGYIAKTAVILNAGKLNLSISAYIAVKLKAHSPDMEARFLERIDALPEVLSCDYLTGETDFMLRVITRDLESYSDFLSNKLRIGDEIETVRSSIILKGLKNTTALSLDFC